VDSVLVDSKSKITCSICVLNGNEFKMDEDAAVAEDLWFVAKSVTFGTASYVT